MQITRTATKRQHQRQQLLHDLQTRVELHKKLEAWFKKQEEREQELEDIIRALLNTGETQTNIKAMTGLTTSDISSILQKVKEEENNHDEKSQPTESVEQ